MEGGGEVSKMMFHIVEHPSEGLAFAGIVQKIWHGFSGFPIPDPIDHKLWIWPGR